ncbi:hypothetical protein DFH27DRAFT_276748 [Peziza echinospora]|nr:hypothetical protein DFH27DRAFT_276748 [Peziza echinospora]
MDSNRSSLSEQRDEVLLIESMYPEEFKWVSGMDIDDYEKEIIRNSQPISFQIRISNLFTLNITLPDSYPEESIPEVFLDCDNTVSRQVRVRLRQEVKRVLENLERGIPILDLLIQEVSLLLPEEDSEKLEPVENCGPSPSPKPVKITRAVIWSHHIASSLKRRDILNWSRELGLGGFSRPGWPGAVVIEGEEADVREFEARLKALQWAALQVRGEEHGTERLFAGEHNGVVEVETIGEVVSGLRGCQAGLQEGERLAAWFLGEMKIK